MTLAHTMQPHAFESQLEGTEYVASRQSSAFDIDAITPGQDWLTVEALQAQSHALNFWLARLSSDPIIAKICATPAFKRLEDISFLGALDYTHKCSRLSRKDRTRYNHSLHVAMLAEYVSELRGYDSDLRRHLVIAALVHDIGHLPLSHSAEPYIKSKYGYGHHELGEALIRGKHPLGQQLFAILNEGCDIEFVISLINGQALSRDGGDLFSSPVNIDTIDGILRSYSYLAGPGKVPMHFLIARAAFGERSSRDIRLLDSFWSMKHSVYRDLINTEYGLLSDKVSEVFFEAVQQPQDNDFLETESRWKNSYAELFTSFHELMEKKSPPKWLPDVTLSYFSRKYYVADDVSDDRRFACTKQRRQLKVHELTKTFIKRALFPSK